MKRLIAVFVAALLLGAVTSQAQLPTAGTQWNYNRDVIVFAGNDSIYGGTGGFSCDSTQLFSDWTDGEYGPEMITTNVLDISQLWLPPFVESYMDSLTIVHTNGMVKYGTGAMTQVATHDSLSIYAGVPVGFRVTAWATTGHANYDTVTVWADVSLDGIGWYNIDKDYIEPSAGTTAQLLDDATTQDRSFAIPAGKLNGWKYLRFRVKGDHDVESDSGIKLYHFYRMYATPDIYKRDVNMRAR